MLTVKNTITIEVKQDERHVDESITVSEHGQGARYVEVTNRDGGYHAAFINDAGGVLLETVDWIEEGVYAGQPEWGTAGEVEPARASDPELCAYVNTLLD